MYPLPPVSKLTVFVFILAASLLGFSLKVDKMNSLSLSGIVGYIKESIPVNVSLFLKRIG